MANEEPKRDMRKGMWERGPVEAGNVVPDDREVPQPISAGGEDGRDRNPHRTDECPENPPSAQHSVFLERGQRI